MSRFLPPFRSLVVFSSGLLLGSVMMFFLTSYYDQIKLRDQFANIKPLRETITNYRLIDPLLTCNLPESTLLGKYTELDAKLQSIVAQEKTSGKAKEISIYFHELPGGRWVGIDEAHAYDPASMLKIVLMIAYFRMAEDHLEVLDMKYPYTSSLEQVTQAVPFGATSSLVVGKDYSVNNLIRAMIVESDNGAKDVLLTHVDSAILNQVYIDLKISNPESVKGDYTISPRSYSLFYRVLFNSTYLDRSYSEKALQILTETLFNEGIVAGVPSGTTVAHKFGEHILGNSDGSQETVELHDCGIVYAPNLPYFLCVMTSGESIVGLKSVISDISSIVYQSVSPINIAK